MQFMKHTFSRYLVLLSAALFSVVGHPDTAQAQNGIAFSPNALVLTTSVANPGIQTATVTVTVSGQPASTLSPSITVNSGPNPFSVTSTITQNQSYLTIIANPAGLQAGSYTGTLSVTTNGVQATLPVTLTIYGANTLTLSTYSLQFNGSTGGTSPPSQTVNITGNVPGIPFTVSVATATGGGWLSAAQTGTAVPASLVITANPGNLAPGTYTGTVTVTSDQSAPQVISVHAGRVGPADSGSYSEPGYIALPVRCKCRRSHGDRPGFIYRIATGLHRSGSLHLLPGFLHSETTGWRAPRIQH